MPKEFYSLFQDDLEKLRIGPPGSNTYYIRAYTLFDYPELPGPNYIRLLYLEKPSEDPSKLTGSLQVHKLDQNCEFEAISYAWGDGPESDSGIIVNDQILRISRNLYAALMAFGYSDRTRVLWADAICINQADKIEKTQQVAIMADIYSQAKSVLVWIAPTSIAMRTAMHHMSQLSSKGKSLGLNDEVGYARYVPSFPTISVSDGQAASLLREAINAYVDRLVSYSWFKRMWVLQEVTLASNLTVHCGHSTLDWTSFARALEILRAALMQVPIDTEMSMRLCDISYAWELVRQRDIFRFLDEPTNRNHHVMTQILWKQMNIRHCSDDRDRVYAMLAMTKSPYTMTPDYEKTVAEAYAEFTRRYSPVKHLHYAGLFRRKAIKNTGNLDPTADNPQASFIDLNNRDYLPSWVPEFRPSRSSGQRSIFCGRYRTASHMPFFFRPHPLVLNVMFVTGTIFDTVSGTSYPLGRKIQPNQSYDPSVFFTIITQLQRILGQDADTTYPPTSEPLWLALAKVLTGGVGDCDGAEFLLSRQHGLKNLAHLGEGTVPWLTAIWKCFAAHCCEPTGEVFQFVLLRALGVKTRPFSADAKVASAFLNHVANILLTNLLFGTRKGYIGLAPRLIRSGRFIAVFNGCEMPYVVSPAGCAKCGDEVFEHTLQVIGPCYLHGLMNQELEIQRDAPHFADLVWRRVEGDFDDSLEGWMTLI
jgi:hypothetical protein